jgi:uncharacterized membrane protein YraQ (UPF0718 family)/copper chaperone CopZ
MIIDILNEVWILFLEMGPYLMIGMFFAGLLHVFFTKEMVVKYIGKNNIWSVIKASLFGVPLPLCSCGVIPSSVFLSKSGASRSSVVSFLISTPQTGIDSIIATYGMLGWVFAVFRPIAAFAMGIIGGIAAMFIKEEPVPREPEKKNYISLKLATTDGSMIPVQNKLHGSSLKSRLRSMFHYGFVEFLDDIVLQFIIGLVISGLIAYFVPDSFFSQSAVGSGIVGMLLMIAIGAPMYVCATASIPIAMTLMMKGFSPGTAFVFLAVGPATNAASFSIIMKVLGKRTAFTFLAAISLSSIAFGYLLDFLFVTYDLPLMHNHEAMNHNHELIAPELKLILGIIFLILLLSSLYRKYVKKYFMNKNTKLVSRPMEDGIKKINISGMTCNHCVMNVQKTISEIPGIQSVEVRLDENAAYVRGNYDENKLRTEIESIGYKVI